MRMVCLSKENTKNYGTSGLVNIATFKQNNYDHHTSLDLRMYVGWCYFIPVGPRDCSARY
jgi:hypothetical protein